MITPEFFDLEIYSIYKAIFELLGEDTWKVVWRSGEVLLDMIWNELNLEEKDLFQALKKIASYLKQAGYISDINIEVEKEGEILKYVMTKPVIAEGAKRLIQEGMVPPHISTSLMFALLKKKGYSAEMIGDPEFLPDGRVVEKWRLKEM